MKITTKDRVALKNILNRFKKKQTKKSIFYSLCFCLCAPQTTFKKNTQVIRELKAWEFYERPIDLFIYYSSHKDILKKMLKPVRFYNNKAKYLIGTKKNFDNIYKIANSKILSGYEKRTWLVKNVKGMGMKVASHFLRNLGHDELAIIDTHIIKFMEITMTDKETFENGIVGDWGKFIQCKKGYETAESYFQEIAGNYRLTTAELDALVWKNYSKTDWKEFKY